MHLLNESLVFATLYGSRLYRTAGPNSDTDVRGVFIPNKRDLLLGTPPQHYICEPEKDTDEQVDEQYLSLHYFLKLLTQGETNTLDMFFSYTNKEASLVSSPVYEELIRNKDKIITCNITKYLGYCKSQALKYSIKGERIQHYESFMELIDTCESPSSTTLGEWLVHCRVMGPDSAAPLGDAEDYFKNNVHVGRRFKITDNRLGDHAYLLLCDNKERYIMVSGHLFPQNANINTTKDSIRKCLASYGQRAYNAAVDNGADYKALSHALRVAYQAHELLRKGTITFPLSGSVLQTVREIKFKETSMTYDDIIDLIKVNIEIVESCLKTTTLPKQPDWGWINEFILQLYKEQTN